MTDREMIECALCAKHGDCAIEAAGGHLAILNSEERMKLEVLYRRGIPEVAVTDMRSRGYTKNKNGKWVKREEPMTSDEQYELLYEAANVAINFGRWLEPIITGAVDRVKAEYEAKREAKY